MEIGGDDSDAVVVPTYERDGLDDDLRIAGGRQLERETHIATSKRT